MTRDIRESIDIAAPADRIFRCLTDPQELLAWWTTPDYPAVHWEVALERGGKWLSRWRGPHGEEFALGGEIIAVDPPTMLEYTWWDERYPNRPHTRVRYEITPTPGGCRVSVWHFGFDDVRDDFDDYNGGWSTVLTNLCARSERQVVATSTAPKALSEKGRT
jgi:uncharacterized protein YndB with AHSA1/START domain